MNRIYLDHAATTPLSAAAREAMLPWLDAGNPSSLHAAGRRAKDAIDASRETLSEALGCEFGEVLFTSGGTEAANLAIVGAALQNTDSRRRRVLLGAAEHHCVLHTQAILQRLGYHVETIPVDREARIDLDALDAILADDVLLVSTMHANNELGSINDIAAIRSLVHQSGAFLHVDAVQTFLRPDDGRPLGELGADTVTVSSHKVNGPKGAGAIYLRAGVKLKPLVGGGGQEREVRGGTENVAAIVGFAAAVRERMPNAERRMPNRDRFLQTLEALGAERTVRSGPILTGHAHVRIPGRDADTLLIALDRAGVAASSGAACSSGSIEPSHVLLACGYTPREAREGLRFTFSPDTTDEDLTEAAHRLGQILHRPRQ